MKSVEEKAHNSLIAWKSYFTYMKKKGFKKKTHNRKQKKEKAQQKRLRFKARHGKKKSVNEAEGEGENRTERKLSSNRLIPLLLITKNLWIW